MFLKDNIPFEELIKKSVSALSYEDQIMYARLAAEAAREKGHLTNEMLANFSEGVSHLKFKKNYEGALKNFTWILSQIENKSDNVALTNDNATEIIVNSFHGWVQSAAEIPSISDMDIYSFFYAADHFIEKTGLVEHKPHILHERSIALIEFCRFDEALLVAEEALALKRMNEDSPGCDLDHYLEIYSEVLSYHGRHPDALEVASEYIEKSEEANAWSLRGWLHFQLGNYDDAIDDLNEAIFIEEDADCYKKRAMASAMLGDSGEAIKDLKNAGRKKKRDIEISLWLAGISNKFGHLHRLEETENFHFNLVKFYLGEIDEDELLRLANTAPSEKKLKEYLCASHTFMGLLKECPNNKREAERNYKLSLNTDCIWFLEYDWSKAKLIQLG